MATEQIKQELNPKDILDIKLSPETAEETRKFFIDTEKALNAFDSEHPDSLKFNSGEPEDIQDDIENEDDPVYYDWGSNADEDPDPMETDEEYDEGTLPGQ